MLITTDKYVETLAVALLRKDLTRHSCIAFSNLQFYLRLFVPSVMPTAKVSKRRRAVACQRKDRRKGVSGEPPNSSRTVTIVELANTAQPEPFTRITISALPDNVLLEIFDFYLDVFQWIHTPTGERPVPRYEDLWHTLVHVCRHWRCVVTASPRRLNLQLLCTEKRPVKRNVWPDLPILINPKIPKSRRSRSQGVNIIMAALKQQHNRVSQIAISDIPNSLLKKFAAINQDAIPQH